MKRTHFVGKKNNKMESHCFIPDNACIYQRQKEVLHSYNMDEKNPWTSLIKLFFLSFILEGNTTCMLATSSKIKNDYAHHDNFNFMVLIR